MGQANRPVLSRSAQRPRLVFAAVDCAAFEAADFCPVTARRNGLFLFSNAPSSAPPSSAQHSCTHAVWRHGLTDGVQASRAVHKKQYPVIRYFERLQVPLPPSLPPSRLGARSQPLTAPATSPWVMQPDIVGRGGAADYSPGGEYGQRVPAPASGWNTASLIATADRMAAKRLAAEAERELGAGSGGGDGAASVDYSKLSVKLLKKLLKDKGAACLGCSDKREFVAKAEEVLGAGAEQKDEL